MLYLITGAPGWLGTRLVEALTGGVPDCGEASPFQPSDEVRCLVLPALDPGTLKKIHPAVRTSPGDVTDPGSLGEFFRDARGAVLFHLAGIIHPSRGIRELFELNVEGTRHVLEAAVAAGVRRIVAVSSNSPAGTNPRRDHLFDEESPYNPYMAYGRSKMRMELILQEAFRSGRIETVVLRPCWFYGPGQPPRQTEFFTMIRKGLAPIVGGGENKRSLSYVDNTCQALLLAARSEAAKGRTYWVADERPYTMNEIVDTVEKLLEAEFGLKVAHRRVRIPGLASSVAYLLDGALQGLGLYHQKIHVLSEMDKTIACSVEKAKRELGYRPAVALEEGMRRSIKWCLGQGHAL